MKTLKMLEILIALSIASTMMIPVFTIKLANAVPIDPIHPNITPDPLVNPIWWDTGSPTGLQTLATLGWNPEFLLAHADTLIDSDTTIHITGLDQYGAMIEAKAFFPQGSPVQWDVPFVDPHSGEPVAFSKITGIFQQNGTHCNHIEVKTAPNPFEQYLGQYHNSTGYWEPTYRYITQLWLAYPYQGYKLQDVPVEPVNPEPIKILINWIDAFNATTPINMPPTGPEWTNAGSKGNQTMWIEGIDEAGNKLIIHVNIPDGAKWVNVDSTTSPDLGLHTFSTICKVWGGSASGDSYYIFTHPMPQRNLFEYYIRIHHLVLYPTSYDILANPGVDPLDPDHMNYPGVTNITLVMVDMDGHLVHASKNFDPLAGAPTGSVVVNWWTSGGKIHPSYSLIPPGGLSITVNLTADTNARTIKVVADANVPTHQSTPSGYLPSPPQNLLVWTNLVFDGINSAFNDSLPVITPLQWGYTTMDGLEHGPFNAPPEPPLATVLGGPAADSMIPPYKLNGPIYEVSIPLYPGCNLISSPVYPIFGNLAAYYSGAYGGNGIPMDLLFNMTSATETIEAIWWYENGTWFTYIPGVTLGGTEMNFQDGVGYWIKAEKYCTLELSGVEMENAPFVPAEYNFYPSWNLMGLTSIHEIPTKNYFEGVSSGSTSIGYPPDNMDFSSNAGPIWVFSAKYQAWLRDPVSLWPTMGMWVYNKASTLLTIAP